MADLSIVMWLFTREGTKKSNKPFGKTSEKDRSLSEKKDDGLKCSIPDHSRSMTLVLPAMLGSTHQAPGSFYKHYMQVHITGVRTPAPGKEVPAWERGIGANKMFMEVPCIYLRQNQMSFLWDVHVIWVDHRIPHWNWSFYFVTICFLDIPHFSENPISRRRIPSGDVIEGDFRMVIEGDFLSFLAALSTYDTQLTQMKSATRRIPILPSESLSTVVLVISCHWDSRFFPSISNLEALPKVPFQIFQKPNPKPGHQVQGASLLVVESVACITNKGRIKNFSSAPKLQTWALARRPSTNLSFFFLDFSPSNIPWISRTK